MSERGGDVGGAGQAKEADGGVAQGGHHLWGVSGAGAGSVFVVCDVADPVGAVLDPPVVLDPCCEGGRRGCGDTGERWSGGTRPAPRAPTPPRSRPIHGAHPGDDADPATRPAPPADRPHALAWAGTKTGSIASTGAVLGWAAGVRTAIQTGQPHPSPRHADTHHESLQFTPSSADFAGALEAEVTRT